jgi:hypothetical protein
MVKRIIVIVLAVQLLLACPPMTRPTAALERDQDPEQLWNIGWELSQDCFIHKDPLRVKIRRHASLRGSGHIRDVLPPTDLLRELLPSSDLRYVSNKNSLEKPTSVKCINISKELSEVSLDELLETSITP